MQIIMSLETDWDETDNKSMTDQHPSVNINVRVNSDNFPTRAELDSMYEKFAAAIGAKAGAPKVRELGGSS